MEIPRNATLTSETTIHQRKKEMVNVPYHTSKLQGRIIRSLYNASLDQIINIPLTQTQAVPINIYSFSCLSDLPEQVASIRSFIKHVGIPKTFTVISDGTYTPNSEKLLSKIHPCVKVVDWTKIANKNLPQCVFDFASYTPIGKKTCALMSIPIDGATAFTDADILFFPGGTNLNDLATSNDSYTHYLVDCAVSLDLRMIYDQSEILNPVNSGFTLFKQELDWSLAIERLSALKEPPIFFTEQTILHFAVHRSHCKPLDPKLYILDVQDQFIYADRYAQNTIALRHYVSDIRHKFWCQAKLSI